MQAVDTFLHAHICNFENFHNVKNAHVVFRRQENVYAEHLRSLELLTTEFFSPGTQNDRKKEIDSMFQDFNRQSDSWKHCLYFVQKSDCQCVTMFALTSIENTVLRKWTTLTYPEKVELKSFLWNYFTKNNKKTPSFIRNKMAKLIVDIGRHDWPSSYPEFFSQVLELLESGGHVPVLGLVIVRAIVEGLGVVSGSEQRLIYLPQERHKELQRLFLLYIPQLLNILTSVLDRLAQTQLSDSSFPNPPPSPERCIRNSSSTDLPDLLTSSNTPLSRCGNQESREECVNLCLGTLQQIFSYLPHASNLPTPLVASIFHWASIATQTEFDEDVCIAGMSTLNELLYQRHVSVRSLIMSQMTNESLKLLHHLVTPPNAPLINSLSQMYIDKVSEFLQLFVSIYFKSLDSEPEFDSQGFLLLLFQYTFQVPLCSSFLCCLDIWNQFLDILKPQDAMKYSEALMGLVSGIGNKIQFQHNSLQLQIIDNDTVNDDGETDWQVFLRNCVECIAKVAEFSPLHMFNLVLEVWHPLVDVYEKGSATHQEMVDLSSFTQLLGRLAPTLFLDKEESTIEQNIKYANIFLERLVKLLQHCSKRCLDNINNTESMTSIHTQVQSGALACMGSWTHYISRCSAPSCSVQNLIQIASFLLVNREKEFPPVLLHASAHMLLSIVVSMRPTDPLQYIPDLYMQAQHSLNHLPPKTATVVRQALCTMILECPIYDAANSVEAKRMQACTFLISAWCSSLLAPSLNSTPLQRLACLPALTHLLKYFADHPTNAKKILATAVEKPVHVALEVFQNASHSVDVESNKIAPIVLDMFLALLHSLHHQLGNVFIRNSIHMFLDIAKKKSDALHQLLCVLQVGVEGGSLANSATLEEVLTMCLDHVLPLVQSNNTDSDVAFALFDLFGSILLNRWQHFYSSCVRQGWSPVGPEGASDGAQTDHLPHFCAIMQAITSSFLTDNIEIVRLNLRNLDFLNIRYKLYSKVAFQQQLLGHTLEILLRVLIQRTAVGTLLQEEVITTCYNLASVDFTAFFNSFLPSFLGTIQNVSSEEFQGLLAIPKETDLPSFTQNLLRFTNDIRCYQMSREITY